MLDKSLILVGGPGSGKSNFLARLWLAFNSQQYELISTVPPDDLAYIEDISAHVLEGQFVPRTDPDEKSREFNVAIKTKDDQISASLIVPDMYGEIWKKAVSMYEIPEKWLVALQQSSAALLFIRVHSDHNIDPLDWVSSRDALEAGLGDDARGEIPTQVSLLELLRFIDENIQRGKNARPKVAVLVTAWDLLSPDEVEDSPEAFIEKQYPMFFGKMEDITSLEVKAFGCSIVGGDLNEIEFQEAFLVNGVKDSGYVIFTDENKAIQKSKDITKPINWLLS